MKITPVILSGGGGTRLWPMSRPECPKQFLALVGDKTMFTQTLARVSDRRMFDGPVILCGQSHEALVKNELQIAHCSNASLVLEPAARNTAPAIALAANLEHLTDALLLVMPSDHVIVDEPAFHAAIQRAKPFAEKGWLVTFGIRTTAPETGYGYIQQGTSLEEGVFAVSTFVEKPDLERAKELHSSDDYVWNGGIFMFRADAYLAALTQFAPDIAENTAESMAKASVDANIFRPDPVSFLQCRGESIDYAVMEKADKVAVVPVDMGWSDLGSWDALYDLGSNEAPASVTEIDGSGNLLRSDGVHIHTVGVNDMIVIASGNDVLIVPRGKSQDVKKLIEAMKQ